MTEAPIRSRGKLRSVLLRWGLPFAAAGIFVVWSNIRLRRAAVEGRAVDVQASVGAAPTAPAPGYWTCSMHPQVRLDRPGDCPICEMPLIPAGGGEAETGAIPTLTLSPRAMAIASVETTPVTRRDLDHEIRAVGKIQYNEWSLATVTSRVDGYAERLFVNVTGVDIKAGHHLAEVYSPDLLVAQQELLLAVRAGSGSMVESARLKLRRWGLTDQQIDEVVQSQKVSDRMTLYSPIDGTVIEKSIFENSAFQAGDALYRVANLDTVWVYLDIYELDLGWVRYGQHLELSTEAYPGRPFHGMVTFIKPILDEDSRTVRVPVHVENKDHALKPGMYVSAMIRVALGPDGQAAATGVEGKFSCPMHPQVLKNDAGDCPLCGMPLERVPGSESPPDHDPTVDAASDTPRYVCPMKCEGEKTYEQPGKCPMCRMNLQAAESAAHSPAGGPLAVPITAVLDSGTRRIVYIEKGGGTFEPRDVTVGPRSAEFFPVLKGLNEGERVVTRGGFLIDSQFQVTGHPSLFYPGGLHASMGHQHGDAAGAGPDVTSRPEAPPATRESDDLPPTNPSAPERHPPSSIRHPTSDIPHR